MYFQYTARRSLQHAKWSSVAAIPVV